MFFFIIYRIIFVKDKRHFRMNLMEYDGVTRISKCKLETNWKRKLRHE